MDRKKETVSQQQESSAQGFWTHNAARSHLDPASAPDVSRWVRDDRLPRQRVGIRKAVPCSILVKTGASFILARKIHDISLVGAFVDLDTAGLEVGEIVDVVIDFSFGDHQVEHQITAEITRVEQHGVGLKFNAYGNRTYTDLVNLLYAS